LAAIKAGKTNRKAIAAFVAAYDAPGITKQIKFTAEGEVAGDAVYAYQVTGGKLVPKGII
jgi:branched-chain amino acid transport system substrate-binding protein